MRSALVLEFDKNAVHVGHARVPATLPDGGDPSEPVALVNGGWRRVVCSLGKSAEPVPKCPQ